MHNWNSVSVITFLFNRLLDQETAEETLWSSSQATIWPLVNQERRRLHIIFFIAEHRAGKLWIPIFIIFGLICQEIELESIVSISDALPLDYW